MTENSSARVPDRVLAYVAPRFGIQPDGLRSIGTSGSSVHEFWQHGQRYVLRVSRGCRRTLDLLSGELDWIGHLSENGVSVCTPIASRAGNSIEIVEVDGAPYAAVAFCAAEGTAPVDFIEEWDDDLFQQWGHLLGRMHALAKTYRPTDERLKRPEWHQMDDVDVDMYVPSGQATVLNRGHSLLSQLKALPKDSDSYGLIHADLHRGNFFVRDGILTVFDFDSCQYCWLAYDIAVSLFHAVMKPPGQMSRESFAQHFIGQLMRGYRRANTITRYWLCRMPLFLRLRRMVMYIDGLRYWNLDNLTEKQRSFLEGYRQRIETDDPVLDIDFSEGLV